MTAAIATPPLTFIFPRELSYLSRVAAAPHRIAPFFLRDARSLTRESLLLELSEGCERLFSIVPSAFSLMAFRYVAGQGQTMATQFCKTLLRSSCGFFKPCGHLFLVLQGNGLQNGYMSVNRG